MSDCENYTDYVELAVKDIYEKLQGHPLVEESVFTLYSQDNLEMMENIKYPALAVVYSGTVPINNAEKQGLFATIRVDVFIIVSTMCEQTEGLIAKQGIYSYTNLLGSFRNSLKGVLSPTQKFWEFRGEIPYEFGSDGKDTKVGYIQSWETKINLRDL
jgi:hypothetical protein